MKYKKLLEEKLSIKIGIDSYQQLDNIISAVLNADNIIGEDLIINLFKIVLPKECEKFYYIFLEFLERIQKIKTNTNVKCLHISEVLFKQYIIVNLNGLIVNDDVNIAAICEEVQEPLITNTPEGEVHSKHVLYSYCLLKFRELKDMKIDLPTGSMFLSTLYSSILTDYSLQSLKLSAIILENGIKLGDTVLMKSEGYSEFIAHINTKLTEKKKVWQSIQDDTVALNSLDDYNYFMNRDDFKRVEVCEYGLPPIDKYSHVYNTDIINITAMEGTGKTTYCCSFACREILAGYSVIFMCGESEKMKILHMILSHFIYLKTQKMGGYEIKWDEIAYHFEELPESWRAVINECRHDFFTNTEYGKLILVDQFSYNNFKQEVVDIVSAHTDLKWGHLIIDHTNALKMDNNIPRGLFLKDRFAGAREMFAQIKELKKEYHLPSLTTSHLKSELEKDLIRGKDIGTRIGAGSGSTSTDVDVMLFFQRSETLKKKNLLLIEVKKFREVPDGAFKPFIVRREFTTCTFYYSDELQAMAGTSMENELSLEDLQLEEYMGE